MADDEVDGVFVNEQPADAFSHRQISAVFLLEMRRPQNIS